MLAAFAKGKNVAEVLDEVCKVDRATFEKGYKTFLGEVVKTLRGSKPVAKRRTIEELRAALKKKPEDADVAAELALRLVNTKRAEARKLVGAKDSPARWFVMGIED